MLQEVPRDLAAIIGATPGKRSSLLDHMRDLVQRLVQKSLFEFKYVHNILWEYAQAVVAGIGNSEQPLTTEEKDVDTRRMEELVSQLADAVPKLVATKAGAKLCCLLITRAAAKDRKRIMKALKGKALESLLHEAAHLSLMRLVDVTDDSVQIQKSIFDELLPRATPPEPSYSAAGELLMQKEPLLQVALSPYGHKLLLRLLNPRSHHLEPDERPLFEAEAIHSKKSPSARRAEHLMYLRRALINLCVQHTEELLRSRAGGNVLVEVVSTFLPSKVLQCVADVFAGRASSGELDPIEGGHDEGGVSSDEAAAMTMGEIGDEDADENEGVEVYIAGDQSEVSMGTRVDEIDPLVLEEFEASHAEDLNATANIGEAVGGSPVLPIEEDPFAHGVLKKLLRFEKCARRQQQGVTGDSEENKDNSLNIDHAFWERGSNGSSSVNSNIDALSDSSCLSKKLVDCVFTNRELLTRWVRTNRACFLLNEILNTLDERDKVTAVSLIVPFADTIAIHSDRIAGCKVLLNNIRT